MRRHLHSLMETAKVQQPKWYRPKGTDSHHKLKLYNSLTRQKDEFIPLNSPKVTWYSCGPTVYDSAHMGHARNYVAIDINRRLLSDYFGYDVEFVQNVTDIDDKIIVRARQNYLFKQFANEVKQTGVTSEIKDKIRKSIDSYTACFKKLDLDAPVDSASNFDKWVSTLPREDLLQKDPKFVMNSNAVSAALHGLEAADNQRFLEGVQDVYVKTLDAEKGATVTDHNVFRDLSSYYEDDFNQDMRKLNVRPPSVTTRVSEYLPEIINYVEDIIAKGYAYPTADGSVYFDVQAFAAAPNHDYAKLQPWNKGVQELIDEGEGSLSLKGQGKKSTADFALWKASKPGEPFWPSPWGNGRPGWHIECSVMASHVLGSQIDIHTGGIDLAFPHHDNELAQAEACYDCKQWINYFLHTGHLHIEGQKMSKSLKNFITIREALDTFSARQLRLAFAFQQWNTPLDFKMSLSHVKAWETTISNFFKNVTALRRETTLTTSKKVDDPELNLLDALSQTQVEVDAAFADNLNVPLALNLISTLVQKSNEYIKAVDEPKVEVLVDIAAWITKILDVLGFEMNNATYGWAQSSSGQGIDKEDIALPFVQALAKFRSEIRRLAISGELDPKKLLELCDKIRDVDLFELGVSLDDRKGDQASLIKFMTPEEKAEVVAQRESIAAAAEEKARRKAESALKQEQAEKEKQLKAQTKPENMFLQDPQFSKFDEKGLPTHMADGEPVSKSLSKKLQKQYQAQEKLYMQYH